DVRGERVDVWEERVAQRVELHERLIHRRVFIADVPELARTVGSMQPEDWAERAVLEPACVQLAPFVERVAAHRFRQARVHRVAARIARPVRRAGNRKAETGGNLFAERLERRGDVAGPRDRGIALDAGETGSREDEDALIRRDTALAVV